MKRYNLFLLLFTLNFTIAVFGQTWSEHTIASTYNGARSVYATDVDGDGDMDVLGAAYDGDYITWWENDGSETFTERIIANATFNGATSVYATDVDGDGDVDVLGAAYNGDDITWWDNDGTPSDGGWTERAIDNSTFNAAYSVYATDVDGDGDVDALGAAYIDDDITWWKNDGNETFTKIAIDAAFNGAISVYATDVDSDGDVDVLGTAFVGDEITWWENDGSESFIERTIDAAFNGATSVYATDIDGDGDMDVLGAAYSDNDIAWWENDGSESFTKKTIDAAFNGVRSVRATDVDGDGDMDILGAAYSDDDITWWENDGSEGFTKRTIDAAYNGAYSVYATDVDGDGDMDVLGAAYFDDDITWWEQTGTPSKTVSFTDGSGYNPSVTLGQPNQAIGRFQLTSTATFSLTAATIKLNGTRTGASDFRLWQSSDNSFSSASDIQLGSMVEYDPGTGNTVTFNNFVSPISSSGTYYFLTCDVASDATGSIQGVLVQNSRLTFSGGTLSSTISNDALSGGDVSLPVELTSFTARVNRSGSVVLEWVTESEIENLGFILERREDSGSGSWQEIASYVTDSRLQGQGSVTYRTEYSYTDNTVELGKTYDYRLADVSYAGVKEYHSLSVLSITVREVIPEKFALYPAYPNPFNPATTIAFDLPSAQRVTIAIYDLNGREVATLTNQEYSAGSHSVKWNASHLGSGVYLYRLNTGSFAATGKLLLVK